MGWGVGGIYIGVGGNIKPMIIWETSSYNVRNSYVSK